jgi:hypothetical protein
VAGSLPRLEQALGRTAAEVRQTTVREAWYRLAWRWMALVAGLFVLDLLFGLPVWLRWPAFLGQAGFVLWSIQGILARQRGRRVEAEWAARAVEERHPELDNALINAVQFGRALPEASPVQASLMRREMDRAESAAATVPVNDGVDRVRERKALRLAAWLLGGWAAVALLFSSGFLAVMPRLFLPWMDEVTPPFSFTRFEVRPPGATVRYGDSLNLAVIVSGPAPGELALMTRTPGTDWRRMALDGEEPGKYSVTLDNLREETWFYIQGGGSRSARYRIRILTPPRVKTLRATYTFPAYAARKPATETVGAEGVHGLATTKVSLEVTSNRALRGGEMRIQIPDGNEQAVPFEVDPKDHSRAAATFSLSRSGTFRVALTAEDGQSNPEAAKGKVTLDRDERPAVWIEHPGQDLLVTGDMKIPIRVQAEDDNGIRKVEVHRIVNELGDSPQSFTSAAPSPHADHTLTMDLADLGVRPGDEIKYYATAYDNDPRKPNVAETEPYAIKVVSPEEYEEALKQQRTAQEVSDPMKDVAAAIQDLADRQAKLAAKMAQLQKQLQDDPANKDLQKKMREAREEQRRLQQEARQLARAMKEYARSPSGSDLERAIKEQIGAMALQVSAAANGPMEAAQGTEGATGAKEAARKLQAVNAQMRQGVQKAVEHLEKMAPLYSDIERFKALLDRQGQLVLKARQFQEQAKLGKEGKARLEELAEEQNRIQDELKQLQDDLRQHAQAAKDDFPKAAESAVKIADEIGRRQIPALMQAAQDRFRQWMGPEGFDRAQFALKQMEAMLSQCKEGQQAAQSELDLALSRSLGQKGLGRSLSSLSSGNGQSRGSGIGIGVGGAPSGPSAPSGGGSMRSARAYVPSAQSLHGTGGPKRRKSQNRIAGQPAGLDPDDVEVMPSTAVAPPKATGPDSGRYPAEYKKLVGEYFKSVAGGK